jgi:Domain of unknown function (DUF397)
MCTNEERHDSSHKEETATPTWRKSSFSMGSDSTCVMFQRQGSNVLLRHSKHDTNDPVLVFTTEEWRAFISGVKAGEFEV